MQLVKNLLFYIGLFIFLFGIANVLFDLTPDEYQLTITYISYFGLYMMIFGDAYPKGANQPIPLPIQNELTNNEPLEEQTTTIKEQEQTLTINKIEFKKEEIPESEIVKSNGFATLEDKIKDES